MVEKPAPRDWLILGLVLALALLVRLPGLNAPLWYDEILTVTRHLRLDWSQMMSSYSMNFHYLHNLQAKGAVMLWGEENWVIRLPALIFGVGTVGAVWALAWRIATPWVAHLTALLLALSFHEIWFSQNARGYTELAFWSTLGTILWLQGMERPTRGIWLAYGATLLLATFTHLTGAFLFVAHGLIWLAAVGVQALRGKLTRPLLVWPVLGYLAGGILTILVYVPILPDMLTTIGGVSGTSAVDVMKEYQSPIWTAYEAIRTGIGAAGPLVVAVGAVVLILVSVGSAGCGRAPLFPILVLVHFALTIVLLLALGMRIWPRFFFTDIGFLMLLIVMGVQMICGWMGRLPGLSRFAGRLFPLAAAAMVVISVGLAARNYMAPKQDLAGAVARVAELQSPQDRVYALGPAAAAFTDYHGMDWTAIEDETDWAAAMADPGPFLAVVAFPGRMFRTIPDMDAGVDDGRLTIVAELPGTLGDGDVVILRRSDD